MPIRRSSFTVHRFRGGFTLVELLVVIAILGVLMAVLVPSLSRARLRTKKVICECNLRDLATASVLYCQDQGNYPTPAYWPAPSAAMGVDNPKLIRGGKIQPHDLHLYVYKQLDPYIGRENHRYPAVSPAPSARELPRVGMCPLMYDLMQTSPAMVGPQFISDWYYTGYGYFGRLDESQSVVLPAGRDHFARRNAPSSAVVWADVVAYNNTYNSNVYFYSHLSGPTGLPHPGDIKAFQDQNVACVDGSVQRRTAKEVGVKKDGTGAGLSYGPYWWWF